MCCFFRGGWNRTHIHIYIHINMCAYIYIYILHEKRRYIRTFVQVKLTTGKPRFNTVRFGSQKMGLNRSVHFLNFSSRLRREFPTASSGYVDPLGKERGIFPKIERNEVSVSAGRLPVGPAKVFYEPFQSPKVCASTETSGQMLGLPSIWLIVSVEAQTLSV